MSHQQEFWKLDPLSDQQLLESLGVVLRTKRRALAELVARLGEVEERRLHLTAAHSSMFSYCVARLAMSEDEACRRIQLARLARRFPALFPELASGQISLSVALVLEPVLSPSNHLELLTAARGNSVRQARELVAARFPSPDVASSIRKLPESRTAESRNATELSSMPSASSVLPAPLSVGAAVSAPAVSAPAVSLAAADAASVIAKASTALPLTAAAPGTLLSPPASGSSSSIELESAPLTPRVSPPTQRDRIEPLSAQRYKVQFTADRDLKAKLEQARDLLRHTLPSGDFGPILSRALDLLIDDLLRRRFGAGARRRKVSVSRDSDVGRTKSATTPPVAKETDASPLRPPRPACSRVGRPARRAVLERDGLGCSWLDAQGVRCGSQAWLELDHREPVGKGGSSEPANLRLLCRAHNRFAAEQEYGREHIERMSTRRRETEHASPT